MTTTERMKIIGSRELKKRLGPNLIRGLIVSVMIHSAVVSIALFDWGGKPPVVDDNDGDTTVFVLNKPMPREDQRPPVIHRPQRPVLPDILVHPKVVTDESLADTLTKSDLDEPLDLVGMVFGVDSGGSGESGSIGSTENFDSSILAGLHDPWTIFIPREVEPVPLSINPQPEYPYMARKAGVEAKIWVWIHVGADGGVVEWKIVDISIPGLGFEEAVEEVIPRWQFTPALQNKNPVAVWVAIPFRFTIKQ
jgi:protein TonB